MLKPLAIAVVISWGAGFAHCGLSSPNIEWQGCSNNPLIECGTYQVPLDYANASAGYANLAMARYKSSRTPRMGTIFTNPGGPGGSGTDMIQNGFGELMSNDMNGQYDIVSFDPRGVNQSEPALSCGFANQTQLLEFLGNSILGAGLEVRGNFTDQKDIDYFYSQLTETDTVMAAFGQRCVQYDGGSLPYVGTAAAARDIINLSEYLEGPGQKINYWGISYGTVIGSYLVNMFPDRVGRVVIDGVVDATAYATQPSHQMWTRNTQSVEATFAGFTQTCAAAGPKGCAIAEEGSTPESIAQWTRELIDTAYQLQRPDIISSFGLRSAILHTLYTPSTWAQFSQDLAQVASSLTSAANSGTPNEMLKRAASGSPQMQESTQFLEIIAAAAVTCVDSIDQDGVTTREVFDELLRVTREETPMFGEMMLEIPGIFCHHYPIRAVERFTGPFNHNLSYPILVIGNQADPITPFESAKSVADLLGNNAYLVEQDDFGHSSLAERSDCTRSVVSDYFLKGKLPEKSKACGTNQILFPGPGVTKSSLDDPNAPIYLDGSQLRQLKKDRMILLVVSCGLAVITAGLTIALIMTCIKNRKNKRYAAPSAAAALLNVPHYSDGRGSMDGHHQLYSEPWEKTVY